MLNSSVRDGGAAKVVEQLRSELLKKTIKSTLWVKKKLTEGSEIFEMRDKNKWLDRLSKWLGRDDVELYLSDLVHQILANDITDFNNYKFWNSAEYQACSVVHCHNLHGMFFNIENLIKISSEKKVIWTLHDMWPITGHCAHSFECDKWIGGCHHCPHLDIYQSLVWDNSRNLWNTKKRVYYKTKMTVVAPSAWLLDKVKKSILSDQKAVLIPNGVDETKFIPGDRRKFKEELGIEGNRKIVLFLAQGGIDNVWKGGEYFKKLYRTYQDKGWLWITIGGNQEVIRNDYWELMYMDSEETKAKYLAMADIFVYPSVADNCPLVVLEAMSCGVPILTFDVGGLSEMVIHKKTGYVAKYKDLNDLENGLNLIMNEKGVALDFGRQARLRVENNYTLKQMVDSYIDLYRG